MAFWTKYERRVTNKMQSWSYGTHCIELMARHNHIGIMKYYACLDILHTQNMVFITQPVYSKDQMLKILGN